MTFDVIATIEAAAPTVRAGSYFDPQRSGLALVMSAIGCHAQHLASHASGLDVARVVADVGALLPGAFGAERLTEGR